MTEDQIKYRRCNAPGCDYKELRGAMQGGFINGKFVCDPCYRASQAKEWENMMKRALLERQGYTHA